MKNKVLQKFKLRYGKPFVYVNSPGRANIIGEHTDYNHGLVLPFAIEQSISMAIGRNDEKKLRIFALDLDEVIEIDLLDISFQKKHWSRYFINSLVVIEHDSNDGIDVVFGGNLPQGGGVSSSSALTCGFLSGVNRLYNYEYDLDKISNLASQAENGIGLNGGMMDQMAIMKGRKHKALLIDFLSFDLLEIDIQKGDHTFYLFNSGQKHNLVDTEYNDRRATCDSAVRQVRAIDSNVETMRDISTFHIENILVGDTVKKRCMHVLEENQRVRSTIGALSKNDFREVGRLLNQSHESLSNNYEVSTREIDYLVDRSNQIENFLGGRIMGGGFGGCTINLVKGVLSPIDIESLKGDYKRKTGLNLELFTVKPSDGVVVEVL